MADDKLLNDLNLSAFDEEIRKQQEYGDKSAEAFAGEALSSATFGLSDAALAGLGVSPERLEEVRKRSPGAAALGTTAGIIAPAIATGGTSVAAKAISAPLKGVTKIGAAAERAATNMLPDVAGKGIATAAIKGAAEGAAIGAGQLAADVALEKRDLSAESLAATVGMGSIMGGGFGTVIGTAQASVPKLLKGVSLGKGVSQAVKEGFDPLADENQMAARLFTKNKKAATDLIDELKFSSDYLGKFAKDELQYSGTESLQTVSQKLKKVISNTGSELEDIAAIMQEQVQAVPGAVTRKQIYQPMLDELNKLKSVIEAPNSPKGRVTLRTIKDFEKDIVEKMQKNATPSAEFAAERATLQTQIDELERLKKWQPLSIADQQKELNLRTKLFSLAEREKDALVTAPADFTEYNNLRKYYDKIKWEFGGTERNTIQADIAKQLRGVMREVTDDLAQKFDPTVPGLSARMKNANQRYFMATKIDEYVEDALRSAPDATSPLNYASTVAGRVARNVAFINDLGQKVTNVSKAISTGINNALKKAVSTEYTLPAMNVLLKSSFAVDEKGRAPKTKAQAFNNIQDSITTLANDPDTFVELLAKKTARVSAANPEIAAILQQKLSAAVQFLNSKLPKSARNDGAFARPYQPSSLELSKFERYLQVIEQPLTTLEELRQGTLTREHVEALQAVYPEIYKEIRVQMMLKLAEKELNLPYERKLQIGILLNIPADSSLTPQSILQLQKSITGTAEAQQQTAPPQFRPAGMEQTGISNRAETEVEKISNRK